MKLLCMNTCTRFNRKWKLDITLSKLLPAVGEQVVLSKIVQAISTVPRKSHSTWTRRRWKRNAK